MESPPPEELAPPDERSQSEELTLFSKTDIVFVSPEGRDVTADLYRPDNDQVYPAVMMIHGGGWFTGSRRNLRDHAREIALSGFSVLNIDYRLTGTAPFPAQIDDVRAGLAWFGEHAQEYHADIDRLGVWGYSAGGHLAALLALNPTEEQTVSVRCCVAGGAPCDLTLIPETSTLLAHFLGGTRQEVPQQYLDASPISYVNENSCPIFFFHGNRDLIVPIESSRGTFEALKKAGSNAQYLELDGIGHILSFISTKARRNAIEFLHEQLSEPPEASAADATEDEIPEDEIPKNEILKRKAANTASASRSKNPAKTPF
jgi:acetyl esterase/lipase